MLLLRLMPLSLIVIACPTTLALVFRCGVAVGCFPRLCGFCLPSPWSVGARQESRLDPPHCDGDSRTGRGGGPSTAATVRQAASGFGSGRGGLGVQAIDERKPVRIPIPIWNPYTTAADTLGQQMTAHCQIIGHRSPQNVTEEQQERHERHGPFGPKNVTPCDSMGRRNAVQGVKSSRGRGGAGCLTNQLRAARSNQSSL